MRHHDKGSRDYMPVNRPPQGMLPSGLELKAIIETGGLKGGRGSKDGSCTTHGETKCIVCARVEWQVNKRTRSSLIRTEVDIYEMRHCSTPIELGPRSHPESRTTRQITFVGAGDKVTRDFNKKPFFTRNLE
jgi:hypothetical protein